MADTTILTVPEAFRRWLAKAGELSEREQQLTLSAYRAGWTEAVSNLPDCPPDTIIMIDSPS